MILVDIVKNVYHSLGESYYKIMYKKLKNKNNELQQLVEQQYEEIVILRTAVGIIKK